MAASSPGLLRIWGWQTSLSPRGKICIELRARDTEVYGMLVFYSATLRRDSIVYSSVTKSSPRRLPKPNTIESSSWHTTLTPSLTTQLYVFYSVPLVCDAAISNEEPFLPLSYRLPLPFCFTVPHAMNDSGLTDLEPTLRHRIQGARRTDSGRPDQHVSAQSVFFHVTYTLSSLKTLTATKIWTLIPQRKIRISKPWFFRGR